MKLYEVTLYDTEDGGHLLAKALFATAKEARDEFKRVKAKMFNGYHYDQPGEYNWHMDNHFTFYSDDEYELRINVVKVGNRIQYYSIDDKEEKSELYRPEKENMKSKPEIAEIFDDATEIIGYCRFKEGFKQIFNNVKRWLADSYIKSEYVKTNKGKRRMKYYVRSQEGNNLVVVVCKNDAKMEFSWHFE